MVQGGMAVHLTCLTAWPSRENMLRPPGICECLRSMQKNNRGVDEPRRFFCRLRGDLFRRDDRAVEEDRSPLRYLFSSGATGQWCRPSMSRSGSGRHCSCDGCDIMDRDSQFLRIDGRSEAGGQDWSQLHGSVLCMACYVVFFTKGSLERDGKQQPATERCSCEACEGQGGGNDGSDVRWVDGERVGNSGEWQQDSVEVAGRVIVHDESSSPGKSERIRHHSKSVTPSDRFCTYEGCRRPSDSSRYFRIDGVSEAGGQDWTLLAGSVLCAACYSQYKTRGTLERCGNRVDPLPLSARRCSYQGCKRPSESSRFHLIDGKSKSGGQDWSELAGSVLCDACYSHFQSRGTLHRMVQHSEPLDPSARRCSYEGCKNPEESSKFYQIDGAKRAGGQDWSSLADRVLCAACYTHFRNRGTLERNVHYVAHEHLAASKQRCSYEGCRRPEESHKFHQIDAGSEAGGRNWAELAGRVLCDACYNQFRSHGTLERSGLRSESLSAADRICSYEGCKMPRKSSKFYRIELGTKAGGRDWTKLIGRVLCSTCYTQYRSKGMLERTQNEPLPASAKRCSYEMCRRPTESARFIQIDEKSKAGGQDWRLLAGRVLCFACYDQYKTRGTLVRNWHSQTKIVDVCDRRCYYQGCKKPDESSHWYRIEEGCKAGGRSWSDLVGRVLCHSCYTHYREKGRLERTQTVHGPLAASARRCSYEGCNNSDQNMRYYQIDEGKTAGGQDWTKLAGKVLCSTCYAQFRTRGTLERLKNDSLSGSTRRCSYEECKYPHQSRQFYQIDSWSVAGGQDWTGLVGRVLCESCYFHYYTKGTFEGTEQKFRPMVSTSLVQPVVSTSLVQPVVSTSLVQPVVSTSLVQPVVSTSLVQPVVSTSLVQPMVSASLVQPVVSASEKSRKRPASHIDSCNDDNTVIMGDNSSTEGAVKRCGTSVAVGIAQPKPPAPVEMSGDLVGSSRRVKREEETCTVLIGVVVDS